MKIWNCDSDSKIIDTRCIDTYEGRWKIKNFFYRFFCSNVIINSIQTLLFRYLSFISTHFFHVIGRFYFILKWIRIPLNHTGKKAYEKMKILHNMKFLLGIGNKCWEVNDKFEI